MKINLKNYQELADLYMSSNDTHIDSINELLSQNLANEKFDKKEWEQATQEERDKKQVSSTIDLKKDLSINELKQVVEICSGKYYHLWKQNPKDFNDIYHGFETREYDKYQRLLKEDKEETLAKAKLKSQVIDDAHRKSHSMK